MDTQIEKLKKQNNIMNREIDTLKNKINNLQELLAQEICLYFEKNKNLRKTTHQFYFDDVKECYFRLLSFYNDNDILLKQAQDYKECYDEIFDKE